MSHDLNCFQVILGVIFFVALAAAVIMLLVWVMADAESRGKSGFLVLLFVLAFQVPGLLIWLVFRPVKTEGRLRNAP